MSEIDWLLKNYILDNYKSIKQFARLVELPSSTVNGIFVRGINNSTFSNVVKICQFLNISIDGLLKGNIVESTLTSEA